MLKNARIVAKDVNPDQYHAPIKGKERGTPGYPVSSSSLRLFFYCPDKWRSPIEHPDGTVTWYERAASEATDWGNMFDCFVLTPTQFSQRYVVIPPDAPRKPSSAQINAKKRSPESERSVEWWQDFEEKNRGKIVIDDGDIYKVRQAAKRFIEYPGMADFIGGCDKQVWIEAEWHDKETGLIVPTKCLLDLLPNFESEYAILDPLFPKCVADLKTTKNAHPASWERWAHAVGYEIQAAWNVDHVIAATGREILSFHFLLSENHAPWQPGKRTMENDVFEKKGDVDSGRLQYEKMMADYCKALKSGFFPGYDDTDEALEGGWTVVRPNPYAEQARQFGPRFVFEEETNETDTAAEAGEVMP